MNTKRIYYKKLVRDKIPEIIQARGSEFEVKTLPDNEYEHELMKKMEEEGRGVAFSSTRESLIDELTDVLMVIEEIKRVKNITEEELKVAHEASLLKKGGFEQRLFLLWSDDDGYVSNEVKTA